MVAMLMKITIGTQTSRSADNPKMKMRNSMAQAAAFTATDMKPVTVVGAPSYASGAHWWNGNAAILKNNPVDVATRATIAMGSLCRVASNWLRFLLMMNRFVLPVSP